MQRAFPDLVLGEHNDMTSGEASLFVLADNFALANMAACGAVLPKYQDTIDRMRPYTRIECLSQADLDARAAHPDLPAAALFASEIRHMRRLDAIYSRAWRGARKRVLAARGKLYRRWRFVRAGILRRISAR